MSGNPVFDFKEPDHVALTCSDMKQTVDFYHGKLGMPVLHLNLRVVPENLRPYAEKLTALGLPYRHVTRYHAHDSEKQATGLVTQGMRGITSLNEYHEPEEGWLMNSIYVFDPDGIEVEFNSWSPEWRGWRNDHVPRIGQMEAA